MEHFVCEACGCTFHVDARGFDTLCVDCTADRNMAFVDLEIQADEKFADILMTAE